MTRSLVQTLLLALTLGGVGHVARAAPAQKKIPKPAPKKTPKKEPKLVTNPEKWHHYQGRMVKRIEITGLRRTRIWRFKHLLDTRVGRPFDVYTFRHDIRRIGNLQLYRPLRVRVEPEGKGVVIRIQTKDKWSLLPYFNLFFNLGSVTAITGIYDVNTLGFLSYVDLQVMLFSYLPLTSKSIRPGFVLNLQAPRLGRLPFTYSLSARAQMSIRTVIGALLQPVGFFQVERYGGFHSLTWEPFQWFRVGVRQTLMYRRYRLAPATEAPSVPLPETGLTHAFALTGSLGYTSYRDYMQHGIILSVALEGSSKHLGSDFDFLRFLRQQPGLLPLRAARRQPGRSGGRRLHEGRQLLQPLPPGELDRAPRLLHGAAHRPVLHLWQRGVPHWVAAHGFPHRQHRPGISRQGLPASGCRLRRRGRRGRRRRLPHRGARLCPWWPSAPGSAPPS